jgi:hypothetical protein
VQSTQVGHHVFNDMIDSGVFEQKPVNVTVQWMIQVGLKHFFVAFSSGIKQSRFFQMIKLKAYGVGRFAKLRRQITQIRGGCAVQEEFKQQLYPGFGGDQRFKHVFSGCLLSNKVTRFFK